MQTILLIAVSTALAALMALMLHQLMSQLMLLGGIL
jgi:hypothetical protein